MHRYTIVVRIFDMAAKTEQVFCTVPLWTEQGHALFRNTITYLTERYNLRAIEIGRGPGQDQLPSRVRLEGDDGRVLEVTLAPELVYEPTPALIGEQVLQLSPFTFGAR